MSASRAAFLQRVRQAVQEGNHAGQAPPLPERGNVGYQGAGSNAVRRFADEVSAAGGQVHQVADREAAFVCIHGLIQAKKARRVLLGRGVVLDALDLEQRLRDAEVQVDKVETLTAHTARDPLFAAEVGISGVDYLIAETGSLAMFARPDNPRSVSLLPPIHIAVADTSQLLPDLFDLFTGGVWEGPPTIPSCVSLITGPSKTGDIELRLVTGVHGPGEVHVVLMGRGIVC